MPGLWPWLRALAGLGILVALLVRLGDGTVLDGLRSIDTGTVLAALGIGLATTVLSAWRWRLVARGLGLPLGLGEAVAHCYRAVFLNSVLPAGVLGDVDRAVLHGRRAGDLGRAVRAVALERCAGLVISVVVGVAALLTRPELLADAVGSVVPGAAATIGVVAVVAVLGTWAVRAPHPSRLRATLRTAGADARAGLLTTGTWPGVVLLSVAALAGYLTLFVVAARAAGSRAALGELLPLLVLALLAMALPVSLGGWGPREAVAAGAFAAGGLGAAQGLTAALVYGVLSLVACLPGGAVLLLWRPGRRSQLPDRDQRPWPRGGAPGSTRQPALRARRGGQGGRGARTGPRGAADPVRGVPGDGVAGADRVGLPGAVPGRSPRRRPPVDPPALGVPDR
ncbi:lysylphosphatidylglycerol synthase transmembrane domain-containing protein [Geodermatophilus sp. URMC 61]|uniref:lysylphosphatidylglycerol synthase transmembrane domain-containing protein n=1 Tax=Geodermatophilus sp. URMC 61 TaxID=3423411 RepID=UPI00406CE27C